MTSAVTNSFRQLELSLLKTDLDSSSPSYHVGISRNTVFNETLDNSSLYFQAKARQGLQSVKTLSNASYVVAARNWVSETIYNSFDNGTGTDYYVKNDANEVFICIQTARETNGNKKTSTVKPTSALAGAGQPGRRTASFTTSDGYVWRWMYQLSNQAIAVFQTTDYLPVKTIGVVGGIPQEVIQKSMQDSSIAGEIIGLAIDSAGVGYPDDSAGVFPTITITGNGDSASFSCFVTDGKITRVTLDSNGSGKIYHGQNYTYASAKITTTSGTGAVLRPIIGPIGGISADPVKALKANTMMFQCSFKGDESGTILAQNDFHQVVVLRGLKKYGSDSDFVSNTGSALRTLTLSSVSGPGFSEDELIRDGTETKLGKVLYHETSPTDKIYFAQDDTTHFTAFATSDNITGLNSGTTGVVSAVGNPDFDAFSGEVLYINNIGGEGEGTGTTGIDRGTNQNEDIRIVIQLG